MKLFTVNTSAVLSNIERSSFFISSFTRVLVIFAVSSGFTKSILYVVIKPTITATIEVTKNATIVVIIIFPSLFGVLIFAIDVVIVKKTSGTITTNNRLIKISPNGLSTLASSLNIIPTIAPIIIANNNIKVDL